MTGGAYALPGRGPVLVEVVNGSLTYEDAEHGNRTRITYQAARLLRSRLRPRPPRRRGS